MTSPYPSHLPEKAPPLNTMPLGAGLQHMNWEGTSSLSQGIFSVDVKLVLGFCISFLELNFPYLKSDGSVSLSHFPVIVTHAFVPVKRGPVLVYRGEGRPSKMQTTFTLKSRHLVSDAPLAHPQKLN